MDDKSHAGAMRKLLLYSQYYITHSYVFIRRTCFVQSDGKTSPCDDSKLKDAEGFIQQGNHVGYIEMLNSVFFC